MSIGIGRLRATHTKRREQLNKARKEIDVALEKLIKALGEEPEETWTRCYHVYRPSSATRFAETYKATSPQALANWLVSEKGVYQYAGRTFRIVDSGCGNEHRYVVVLDIDTGECQARLEQGGK